MVLSFAGSFSGNASAKTASSRSVTAGCRSRGGICGSSLALRAAGVRGFMASFTSVFSSVKSAVCCFVTSKLMKRAVLRRTPAVRRSADASRRRATPRDVRCTEEKKGRGFRGREEHLPHACQSPPEGRKKRRGRCPRKRHGFLPEAKTREGFAVRV